MNKRRFYYGDIRSVQECYTPQSANAAIAEGWILLHIESLTRLILQGTTPIHESKIVYVLGLPDHGAKAG